MIEDAALIAPTPPTPSPDMQAMLNSLRQAVAKALERKRRLGQYAVPFIENKPVAVGEDAPPKQR